MSSTIFLLNNNTLVSLDETPYDSDNLLQNLLDDHPELLAPDQIGDVPRRWLLISGKAAILHDPSLQDAQVEAGRWWVDYLFLDQDSIPTLIEVKRSTDARMRREVVGQMLDYAAHAVDMWQIADIRARFEAQLSDTDPDTALEHALGVDSAQVFWQVVEDNLRLGRIRMIFVADDIPQELQRLVTFLNKQMSPADVLAIALRQYSGGGLRTLVPTVYGQVAQPPKKIPTPTRESKPWDEAGFLAEVLATSGEAERQVAQEIIQWVNDHTEYGFYFWRGDAAMPLLRVDGVDHHSIGLEPSGHIEIQFQHMRKQAPFHHIEMRQEFMNWLNTIEGIYLDDDRLEACPNLPMAIFGDESTLQQFLGVLGWFVDTVHEYYAGTGD